jgi:hypothetical protein
MRGTAKGDGLRAFGVLDQPDELASAAALTGAAMDLNDIGLHRSVDLR